MKKLLTSICLLLAAYFDASAQTKNNFELGVNAGVNIATAGKGANERTALNGGLIGEYYFSDNRSIKVKVSYDQKGSDDGRVTFGPGIPNTLYNIRTDYITVPVMLNWYFGADHGWYFSFGAYVGFLANAKETGTGSDIKKNYNSAEGGMSLGLGYKFKLAGKVKMLLEYDGQYGLSHIYNGNSGYNARNDRTAFNIGLMFPLH